jgi:hypothetical protein
VFSGKAPHLFVAAQGFVLVLFLDVRLDTRVVVEGFVPKIVRIENLVVRIKRALPANHRVVHLKRAFASREASARLQTQRAVAFPPAAGFARVVGAAVHR